MKIEYLLFNVIVAMGPIILSCIPQLKLEKPKMFPTAFSISITALLFLLWDTVVTNYFWYFNTNYITGIYVRNIPIEEILFFFTTPYACIFIWQNLKSTVKTTVVKPYFYWFLTIFIPIMPFILNLHYTLVVVIVFLGIVLFDFLIKTNLFRKQLFFIYLGTVMLLTVVFNGYLTSRPVVTYNTFVKTNINIGTVPIEDILYGIALIGLTTILYEKVSSRD